MDLPEAGTRVDQGEPLVTLRSGDRELTLKAPFAGTVGRVNEAVKDKVSVVQASPYDQGWLVVVTPDNWDEVKPTLVAGTDVAGPYEAKMAADGFDGCA